MEQFKKLSRTQKRDKHQRFSIRKFNVGVASVAIAAFWMVGGSATATEVNVSPESAVETFLTEEALAEDSQEADEEAEPAAEVSQEAAAPAIASEEVDSTEAVPTEVSEASEEVAEPSNELVTETSEDSQESKVADEVSEENSEDVQAPVNVVTRTAATTYRIQYFDAETGERLKNQNYSVSETTSNAADEPHTFDITVALEVPAGYVAVSAVNNAGTELAIVNNAIAAAIVEKDSSTRTLKVTVRKDEVAAPKVHDDEGYTALFAVQTVKEDQSNAEHPEDITIDDTDIAIKKTWTDNVAPTEASRATAEAEAVVNYVIQDTSTVTSAAGEEWTTPGITVHADDSMYTFGISYLGNPFDGGEQTDILTITENDYNERNGREWYVTFSVPKDGSTTDVTAQLVDASTGNVLEEKIIPLGSNDVRFDTLTQAADTDRYKLGYYIDYVSDGRTNTLYFKSHFSEDIIYNGNYGPKDSEAVGVNNEMTKILDVLQPDNKGNFANSHSYQVPIITTQRTDYLLVDAETYQAYLANDKTYLDLKKGTEATLTSLVTEGLDGMYFTIGGVLDFDKYELVETPKENSDETSGVLEQKYEVGERIIEAVGQNHKRIFVFDKEDGSGHFEVWMLNPKVEGHEAFYEDRTTGDRETLEKYYTLIFETDTIAPGERNTKEIHVDFDSLYNWDRTTYSTYTDAYETEESLSRNSPLYSRWGGTIPDATFTYDNGAYFLPAINEPRKNAATGRIGFLRSNLVNNYVMNTQDAEYFYVEKGSVTVHYVDVDGNVIAEPVLDTDHGDSTVTYDTTDNVNRSFELVSETNPMGLNTEGTHTKPTEIEFNGETYYLVEDDTTTMNDADEATGKSATAIVNGVKQVEKDEDGKPADSERSIDTENNMIVENIDAETGEVEAGKHKHLTYVYQKGGDVVVRYHAVDKDGNVLGPITGETTGVTATNKESGEVLTSVGTEEQDTKASKPGTTYDTTDLYPETITTADGSVYRRVSAENPHAYTDGELTEEEATSGKFVGGEEEGQVTPGKTTVINYYYERVTGDVNVHYYAVDEEGNVLTFDDGQPLKESVKDEQDQDINKAYDTTDHRPDHITRDVLNEATGVTETQTYKRVDLPREDGHKNPHAYTDGDTEQGTVEEGEKDVNYYYQHIVGNVHVRHYAVDKDGNVIEMLQELSDTIEGQIDETYDTTDDKHESATETKPEIIKTEAGVTYKRVDLPREDGTQNPHSVTDGDAEQGEITEKDKVVNYYYERISGDVEVHYHIVDAEGNVIIPDAIAKRDVATDENIDVPYSTLSEKDPYIEVDGKVYVLTEAPSSDNSDPEDGTVEEGTKIVNYYYKEVPTNVNVHYHVVDENGEVVETIALKDSVAVETEVAQGTDYDTTTEELKPDTIQTTDGKVYQRVDLNKDEEGNQVNPHPAADGDSEAGQTEVKLTVTDNEDGTKTYTVDDTKDVHYYYEEVPANVNVHYFAVDADGKLIGPIEGRAVGIDQSEVKADEVDTKDEAQGIDYDTTDLRPAIIVTKDAKVYQRVDIAGTNPHPYTTGDSETGTTEVIVNEDGSLDNTKDVNYYYEEVPSNVLVNYYPVDKDGKVLTDENGNPIVLQPTVVDTYNVEQGTDYDTTDHRPTTIVDDNGDIWQLVSVKETNPHPYTDGDDEVGVTDAAVDENGNVTDAKNINYYYEKVTVNVNVHYFAVDEEGEIIKPISGTTSGIEKAEVKADEVDTEAAEQGSTYDTTDLKPATITTAEGKVYQRVDIAGTNPQFVTDGDDEKGKAVATVNRDGSVDDTMDVNYYYEEVTSHVEVNYYGVDAAGNVIKDENGEPIKLIATATDTKDAAQGTVYNTAVDLKPTTVVDADGNVWQLVSVAGTNTHAETDGDEEIGETAVTVDENGNVIDTKVVNYYYEKLTTNVNVHYHVVDKEGNVIDTLAGVTTGIDKSEVASTEADLDEDGNPNTDVEQLKAYDTTDLRPDTIVRAEEQEDGTTKNVTYKRIDLNETNPKLGDDKQGYTDGDAEQGKTEVIVNEDGTVDDTKDVNYYYERVSGNVEVHYHIVDAAGNIVKKDAIEKVDVATDEEINESYDTTSEKAPYIVVDGKVYDLVTEETSARPYTDGDDETGKVAEGTKVVNYYYVERPTNVNVHYHVVDEEGKVVDTIALKDSVAVETDAAQGKAYDTTTEDLRPDTIQTADGKVYQRVDLNKDEEGNQVNPHAYTDGDAETGETAVVVNEDGTLDDTKDVHYYYEELKGDVVVNYFAVDADGKVIEFPEGAPLAESVEDTPLSSNGTSYDTTDNKPAYITGPDGKVYELGEELTDGDPESGDEATVVAGETKVVNYYYREVPTNVNVHYHVVDKEGKVVETIALKDSVAVETEVAQGTGYDTTTEDLRPDTIQTADGKVYQRVDLNKDEEGNQVNPHAYTDGDAETGETAVVVNEDGTLDDTKDVHYYYEELKGDVVVNYFAVDAAGNVIEFPEGAPLAESVEDTPLSSNGTSYDTTDNKPAYITGPDGKVYELVEELTDGDPESGNEATVVAGETKVVNYYYREVPTNVVVNYYGVDENGEVVKVVQPQAEDTVDAAQGTDYNTAEDLRPTTVVDADGNVWQLVSVKGTNPHAYTDGDAEEGQTEVTFDEDGNPVSTKEVNYYYEKVTANVNVHYHVVDETGEVVDTLAGIASGIDKYTVESTEKDTVDAAQGTDYDTFDLRPDTIVKDGVTYKRVDLNKDEEGNQVNPHAYTDGDSEEGQATVTYDAETDTIDDTKDVHYYYERISGGVEVHYHIVDASGAIVNKDAIAPVVDEEDKNIATPYSTEDQRLPYIVVDGKVYDLVTEETSARPYTDGDDENGKIAEGTKVVNYYYVERPTNVNVNYFAVDEDGNVITFEDGSKLADSVVDTEGAAQGEEYDTTDHKPDTIVKDGVTYKRVDLNGTNPHAATNGDAEKGETAVVVNEDGTLDDTKDVNYYYERVSGDVNVHYYAVDENGKVIEFADGQPLAASVVDTEDENLGVDYDTTDHRPDYITRQALDENGEPETRLYKRVDLNGTNPHAYTNGDTENGSVEEGAKDVNYYYEHIVGNVHVHYYAVDENGKVIEFADGSKLADDVLDTLEGEIGDTYDTTDHRPDTIVKDGVTYKRVDLNGTNPHAYTDGDAESADVTEKDRVVNYYYERISGDVVVHYVDTEGNTIAEDVKDTTDADIDEPYNTEDNKPATIKTADGTVYYLTPKETSEDSADVDGKVVEGTTEITYVYEKGGDVLVNYIGVDKDGNEIGIVAPQARDTEAFTKPGTAYDTTDLKPDIITDADGNTWRLVSIKGTNPHAETDGANEDGSVVAGETLEVNYYYELVTGDVVVSYVDEEGNQIAKNEVDTPKNTPTGTTYDTDEDLKPERITAADGTVYYLTEKTTSDRSANPVGTVVEGTTYVEYVYTKAGSVVVNYYPVDEAGNPILDDNGEPIILHSQAQDTTDAKEGTDYDTTDLKPAEITDDQGRTWRLVSVDGTNPHAETDGDEETGAVVSGETKAINYYYELVTGDVIVHYVDTEGNVIADDAVDTEKGTATGTGYNTDEDLKPTTITTADGTVYYLTAKETSEDSASTTGKVVEGTTEITYVYEKAGHVEVHYHIVDENGNVITADAIDKAIDTKDGQPGSDYDTTDHKPTEITVDGVTYVLVADLTDGDGEEGSVVAGTTKVVNYYYVIKETPVAEIIVPETPVSPTTPATVGDTLTPEDVQKVLDNVKVPVGSTAKVTSPVKVDANGMTYVEVTITDANGNTIVVKVPVEAEVPGTPAKTTPARQTTPAKPKYMTGSTKALPNTGEASNHTAVAGLGLLALAFGVAGRRRRKAD